MRKSRGTVEVGDSSGIFQSDADSFVYATLALVVNDTESAYFTGVGDVGAAVGLQIKADDLNGANFGDRGRHQVNLGADQIGDLLGVIARQERDANFSRLQDLGVDFLLDLVDELTF